MYINLEFEMKKIGKTSEDLAILLNKSRKSSTNRLSGKIDFSLDEIILIKTNWFPDKTLDYLFEKKQVPPRH